jgi:hypothetical protein
MLKDRHLPFSKSRFNAKKIANKKHVISRDHSQQKQVADTNQVNKNALMRV